jgi:cytochrome P450
MQSTPLLAVSALVAGLSYFIVYRLVFHPLSTVPGPFLARITKLWLVWHVRQGKSHIFMPALHKHYGPIVRIAPDQVLVCSEDAIRLAYSAGTKFAKGSWYQVCAAPNTGDGLDLLTEMDMEKYRVQRRAIGPAYTLSGLEKHEGALDKYIDKYIAKTKSLRGAMVDLAEWTHIFALDALSWVSLSTSTDYTGKGHDGGNLASSSSIWSIFTTLGLFPTYVKVMHGVPKVGPLLILPASLLLGLGIPKIWPIFQFIVPQIMKRLQALESTKDVKMVERKHFGALKAPAEEGAVEIEAGEEKDLLATFMNLHRNKEAKFKPSWVLGIALTNFGAGHDTVMITLASCLYNLSTHLECMARLRQELVEHGITSTSTYTEIITKVPLVLAILKESLRIYPPVSFYMPRTVPASGTTICDTYLPPSTTIGINLWATHHNPKFFPHPDQFLPDRWLQDGTEERKREIGRMDTFWMGFGGQSRSCPGQNLGRLFVVKVLVRLVMDFEVQCVGTPEFEGWFATGLKGTGAKFLDRNDEQKQEF